MLHVPVPWIKTSFPRPGIYGQLQLKKTCTCNAKVPYVLIRTSQDYVYVLFNTTSHRLNCTQIISSASVICLLLMEEEEDEVVVMPRIFCCPPFNCRTGEGQSETLENRKHTDLL